MSTDPAVTLRAYHQRAKHHFERYAEGPGSLDWDAQPDPFRTWKGTRPRWNAGCFGKNSYLQPDFETGLGRPVRF